ncbi:Dual specificity mitogen-activated protein kinase kinase 1 [Cichlidogyrus casuarinus]|uniref:Dual specificity mitogen-activated protein kinase kinase 1 n=1 Tax=Cichlidogyrus casuarinus TaxID=1844966 RepID=A0ABD2QLR7_9PLAT
MAISSSLSSLVSSAYLGIKCYTDPVRLLGDLLNPLSDVWSLGLISVEMALGVYPYPLIESFDQSFTTDFEINQRNHQKAFENGEPLPAVTSIWNRNAEETVTIFELLTLLTDGPVPRLPSICFDQDFIRIVTDCLKKEPRERTSIVRLNKEKYLDAKNSSEEAAMFVKYLKLLIARNSSAK